MNRLLRRLPLLVGLTLVLIPVLSSAQTISGQSTGLNAAATAAGLNTACQGNCLPGLIGGIINAILGTLGVVLLGLFLFAGFLWMTAGGESDRVKKAKSMLFNAIAGLLIIVASYAISRFVLSGIGQIVSSGTTTGSTTTMNPPSGS